MSSADDLGYAVKTPEHPEGTHATVEEVRIIVRAYYDAHGESALVRDVSVHRMTGETFTGQEIDPRDFL